MIITFVDIIILIAAAQGFLLTTLIFQKYGGLYANRFLGLLMLIYSLILINLLLTDIGFSERLPQLFLLPAGLTMLIGPLNFLYAKYLIHPANRFRKIECFHFLPFSFYLISIFPTFFKSNEILMMELQHSQFHGFPVWFVIFNWVIIILILSYLLAILYQLRRLSKQLKDLFSSTDNMKLDWLRYICYMGISAWAIFFIENILLLAGIRPYFNFILSSFLAAVYVYSMGYFGLLKSEFFLEPAISKSFHQIHEDQHQSPAVKSSSKYEKSGLTTEKALEILRNLIRLMETENPYRKSELTLNQLADMLNISPHHLSEVINSQLNLNFFDFINQYRVDEVKKDLVNSEKANLTLLAIAFDAGFNSKSSFNSIFKRFTNQTPSEYRGKQLSRCNEQ